ncbi:carboxylesterase family protein [Leucobacter allii]|uniref:carboxylesterase/lipase family protein n=1 Tax=Leucobacter allii TaxID=2932247 RepID=UPI001FD0D896|nr:carboxylesterase family protein [Leucobacter allii]UOR02374.1 carboxylesterase family protein [Leucobacter allii]
MSRESYTFTGPHGEICRPSEIAHTHLGKVQGLEVDGINRFLGLQYAQAPVGELRFQAPVDPDPWEGIAEAVFYGPPAYQAVLGRGNEVVSDFALSQMTAMPTAQHVKLASEDCLSLNVWTPGIDNAKRPVFVWFHGGAFAFGAGDEPMYEGSRLARRGDIVVVTVNHRLNALGYLNLQEFDDQGTYKHSGNAGLLDLVHALTWVQKNIAAFGGDPDSVTIAGESGGGGKVCDVMGMPAAKGLFRRAIAQSGASRALPPEISTEYARRILDAAGITPGDADALKAVPADRLVAPVPPSEGSLEGYRRKGYDLSEAPLPTGLTSTIDGETLPASPFWPEAAESMSEVEFMTGWTKDEFTLTLVGQGLDFVDMSEEEALERSRPLYGGRGERVYEAMRGIYPDYAPGHLYAAATSASAYWEQRRIGERKAKQGKPVFLYQLSYESTVAGGAYRSPHAIDLPLMFDNVANSRAFIGEGDDPMRMAEIMSDAWIAFIRTGNPSTAETGEWQPHTEQRPSIMELDLTPAPLDDPYAEVLAVLDEAYEDRLQAGSFLPYK